MSFSVMENTHFKFLGNVAIKICFKIINIINEKMFLVANLLLHYLYITSNNFKTVYLINKFYITFLIV